MVIREVFLMKSMHQYHLSNGENVFILPYHEKLRDYYVNPCLSKLKNVLQFKKWSYEKFFLWNQSINIFNPNEENVFMVPNQKKGDYYLKIGLSQLKDELQF